MSSDCILQIYGIKQARRMAGLFFLWCALRRTFLKDESPKSALVVGRIQPIPGVSIVRWNLKEGNGKSLA